MSDNRSSYTVRQATALDNAAICQVMLSAFGASEGEEIVQLFTQLQPDITAQPMLSLVAVEEEHIVGHILFTAAHIVPVTSMRAALLAPLAVHPARQNQGIGGQLITTGLALLLRQGVDVVFVLGYPAYYQKYGFIPAGEKGLSAPHPILPKNAGAWMVQALRSGVIGEVRGQVHCAEAIRDPKYWQE
ncbi:GNAT family N-acetyltransferase [Thioflexithrix psekupsensis]|uniref:N-acetyltransferase domain-containing protein n=1 Tax=Thioflexithrix psekupsensis TaxID=1570016 RepID=A0A251XC71_9GAMM|nr:N-acetyltransferase [Thioflexithrix psekupsensis]OUD16188.1 hypothetical protein TPSD3_00225 [Thioflexithrix psekupsensis]